MKSNNLTNDVRWVGHQTPEMKINKNQHFNNAPEVDIKLYFRSQFTNNYKVAEKELKKIIDKDVQHHDKDKYVKLFIYYKNWKVKKMFIKNKTTLILKRRTYQITTTWSINTHATRPHVMHVTHTCYIGHTTTTAKKESNILLLN